MKDRGGADYTLVTRNVTLPASDLRLAKPATLPLRLESPTRQADKVLALSGRQRVKRRKRLRRASH